MTILVAYAPEEFALDADREYSFTFPAVDDESIEVYEIIHEDGTDYRYLVPPQDYTLVWNSPSPRYPLRQNGVVVFNRRHSVGTTLVRVERNTLINQTIDFPLGNRTAFNGRMVEYAFDKATIICQEIAQRKCDVSVTTYPITQTVQFGSYDDFPANQINYAITKLFTILQEIDATGEDCTEDLENA